MSFNVINLDAQANANAFLALAAPGGRFNLARPLGPGVQQVLGIAYSGRTLELLTAQSPLGNPCCTTVHVTRLEPSGAFSRPQTIVSDVGGRAIGRLVPLADGRLLAVIAGPQGLWVTEARGTSRFARARRLTRPGIAPVALAVTATPGGGSAVAWTEGAARRILSAGGSPGAAPSGPHTVLRFPAGHQIDGLQLVPRAAGVTLAWTESWNDARGVYHSRVSAADLPSRANDIRPRALSGASEVASGLSLAGAGGDQVAVWEACTSEHCAVHASVRSARRPWYAAASRVGRIDPGETPQVTTAPNGRSLAGWIARGRVVIAQLRLGKSRFSARRPLSGSLAANLNLAFGPSGLAVATWSEGTFAPHVFATVMR